MLSSYRAMLLLIVLLCAGVLTGRHLSQGTAAAADNVAPKEAETVHRSAESAPPAIVDVIATKQAALSRAMADSPQGRTLHDWVAKRVTMATFSEWGGFGTDGTTVSDVWIVGFLGDGLTLSDMALFAGGPVPTPLPTPMPGIVFFYLATNGQRVGALALTDQPPFTYQGIISLPQIDNVTGATHEN